MRDPNRRNEAFKIKAKEPDSGGSRERVLIDRSEDHDFELHGFPNPKDEGVGMPDLGSYSVPTGMDTGNLPKHLDSNLRVPELELSRGNQAACYGLSSNPYEMNSASFNEEELAVGSGDLNIEIRVSEKSSYSTAKQISSHSPRCFFDQNERGSKYEHDDVPETFYDNGSRGVIGKFQDHETQSDMGCEREAPAGRHIMHQEHDTVGQLLQDSGSSQLEPYGTFESRRNPRIEENCNTGIPIEPFPEEEEPESGSYQLGVYGKDVYETEKRKMDMLVLEEQNRRRYMSARLEQDTLARLSTADPSTPQQVSNTIQIQKDNKGLCHSQPLSSAALDGSQQVYGRSQPQTDIQTSPQVSASESLTMASDIVTYIQRRSHDSRLTQFERMKRREADQTQTLQVGQTREFEHRLLQPRPQQGQQQFYTQRGYETGTKKRGRPAQVKTSQVGQTRPFEHRFLQLTPQVGQQQLYAQRGYETSAKKRNIPVLEEQNRKRVMTARQSQGNVGDGPVDFSFTQQQPQPQRRLYTQRGYEMDTANKNISVLEEQNRKRIITARQSQDIGCNGAVDLSFAQQQPLQQQRQLYTQREYEVDTTNKATSVLEEQNRKRTMTARQSQERALQQQLLQQHAQQQYAQQQHDQQQAQQLMLMQQQTVRRPLQDPIGHSNNNLTRRGHQRRLIELPEAKTYERIVKSPFSSFKGSGGAVITLEVDKHHQSPPLKLEKLDAESRKGKLCKSVLLVLRTGLIKGGPSFHTRTRSTQDGLQQSSTYNNLTNRGREHFVNFQNQTELYQKLPADDAIRLLHIEPGFMSDPLSCHLEVTTIQEASPYEGLSYVWGNDTDRVNLTCSGHNLMVTQNLSQALLRLRLEDRSRLVWADAICINQADNKERGHQVKLMQSIYKRASSVVMWLGHDHERQAPLAFTLICKIIDRWNSDTIEHDSTLQSKSPQILNSAHSSYIATEVPDDHSQWNAISQLFRVSYFWRVWVIQEVALARAALVLWGDYEISWRWVGLASAIIRTSYYREMSSFSMTGVYNSYFMYRICNSDQEMDPIKLTFFRLLGLTRQFESTDPRDRIFGLLGLPTTDSRINGEPFIEPNYETSTQDVYRLLAWKILQESQNLDILCSVQHGSDVDISFPSWIPQWDLSYTNSLRPLDPGPGHNAARAKQLQLDSSKHGHGSFLSVKGIICHVVQDTMPIMSSGSNFVPLWNEHWLMEEVQMVTGLFTNGVLAQTLTAGSDWYGMAISNLAAHESDFAAYLLTLRDFNVYTHLRFSAYSESISRRVMTSGGEVDRFKQAASTACGARRLFSYDEGRHRIGLGPAAMQTSDLVCVLFGSAMPFVLRPHGEKFLLVGECYLHDLMHGEALEVKMEEAREFVLC